MTAPVHATTFKMVAVQANALESCVSLCKGITEIGKIFGSKLEDRLLDPFFELVQNTAFVRFSYLFRLCNFCKAPRDMRKFLQKCQKIAGCSGRTVYVHNFRLLRHLAHPLRKTGSRQYHESTMVWRNGPLFYLLRCLLLPCHALFVEKDKTKY